MNDDNPDPPVCPVSSGHPLAGTAAPGGSPLSGEIKVPRSIIRWSKWRQAARRAEHREARRNQQLPKMRPPSSAGKSSAKVPKGDGEPPRGRA